MTSREELEKTQPYIPSPEQPAPVARDETVEEIVERAEAKEKLTLTPGQQVFLNNPQTGELEPDWQYMGTDRESGVALLQREEKDRYGVKTGAVETREVPLDDLKTQHLQGLKMKELAEGVSELIK